MTSNKKRNILLTLMIAIMIVSVIVVIVIFIVPHDTKKDTSAPIQEEIPSSQPDWRLLLVNPWNPLSESFTPYLEELENGHAVDMRIASDLKAMLEAAEAEGLSIIICSSYRSSETQQALYTQKVNQYLAEGFSQEDAEREAGRWVAVPGTSEHQTGLAVDLVALNYQLLDEKQERTPEQKWLMENSYKYGFILRYPVDKSFLTGINYEPWHYRYVGQEIAAEIYKEGLCLEEYLAGIR